jgi:hypothetical protein
MGFTDEQKERFELRSRDLIRWLCENGHPHMTIVITPTSAELLEGSIAVQTTEYLVD